jgi:hypothetical protein
MNPVHRMLLEELEMYELEMERLYEDPSWEFENANVALRELACEYNSLT